MSERIQKIMAHAGYGSRRFCEELIKAGRVTLNGQKASLGDKADIHKDQISVDGKPIRLKKQKPLYIMVHKPRDVISDTDDTGEGRRTVRDMLSEIEGHLYPVGRLDKQSMGLILMTNDGDMAHKLTHPRYEHEKVYRVKIEGNISNETVEAWRKGVELEDGRTAPAGVRIESREEDHTWLGITMREGRKRQIRRVASALGHPVLHLSREQIGPLKLGDLPLGKWRHLTRGEVNALKRSVARGERKHEARKRGPKPKRRRR